MNRIILIGNGFDLAHNLPTGYRDFMDWYWRGFAKKIYDEGVLSAYEDCLVKFKIGNTKMFCSLTSPDKELNSSGNIEAYIKKCDYSALKLIFKNDFWKHISAKVHLETWLDIENEYYILLKSYLNVENRNALVKKLNAEFCQVKNLLEKYLTEVCRLEIKEESSIQNAFRLVIMSNDIALSKRNLYLDSVALERKGYENQTDKSVKYKLLDKEIKEEPRVGYIAPEQTLILNFNYTNTVRRYTSSRVINIHGELNNPKNPIIFGYGDELDEDYKKIEQTNDNDFLNNIKSIHYHNTSNYRQLLTFLQNDPYQVFVMGHSCGNSDRTLLNTIFEHPNCISIKPFYYQWKDKESGVMKDNYTELVKNISRNFNDKQNMRDIVVNKEYCKPLVPYTNT